MRTMTSMLHRGDRGAAALIIALCMVVFCGAAAISVDYGHAVFDKRRVQHAADAAARAVAIDCAKHVAICDATYADDADITADEFGPANAGAGMRIEVTNFDAVARTVTVAASRTTDYAFGPVIGKDSGDVSATATASWAPGTSVPVSGHPVLPFAVPLCSVQANGPDDDGGDGEKGVDVTYRTDLLNQVIEIADIVSSNKNDLNGIINPLTGLIGQIVKGILGTEVRGLLDNVLDPLVSSGSTDACGGDSDIVAAQGGFWLTSLAGAVPGTLNGLFPDSAKPCEMKNISTGVLVGQLVNGLRSSECFDLLGTAADKIKVGDTVLVPVYEPGAGANDSGLLGTPLAIDAGLRLDGGNTVQLNVNVVGFVPFTVTGWDNGRGGEAKNESPDFADQCSSIPLGDYVLGPLTAPLNTLLNVLGTTLEKVHVMTDPVLRLLSGVLNLLASTLNALLPGTGLGDLVKSLSISNARSTEDFVTALKGVVTGVRSDLEAVTLGCTAVRGHFTRQTGTDPAFDWNTPPTDYPSALLDLFVSVKLIH